MVVVVIVVYVIVVYVIVIVAVVIVVYFIVVIVIDVYVLVFIVIVVVYVIVVIVIVVIVIVVIVFVWKGSVETLPSIPSMSQYPLGEHETKITSKMCLINFLTVHTIKYLFFNHRETITSLAAKKVTLRFWSTVLCSDFQVQQDQYESHPCQCVKLFRTELNM